VKVVGAADAGEGAAKALDSAVRVEPMRHLSPAMVPVWWIAISPGHCIVSQYTPHDYITMGGSLVHIADDNSVIVIDIAEPYSLTGAGRITFWKTKAACEAHR
jgi:hypothetical protein